MGLENNKYILPLLVYLPIILVLIIFISVFGVKAIEHFKNTGGLKNVWLSLRVKFYYFRVFVKNLVLRL